MGLEGADEARNRLQGGLVSSGGLLACSLLVLADIDKMGHAAAKITDLELESSPHIDGLRSTR